MPPARDVPVAEGFVPFHGMRTWFRVVGPLGGDRTPLLCLHGGPGMPSDALEPLEALATTGRAVIRYDQLGCGRSDRPRDPSLWAVSTFVDELARMRSALGLERVHLLGWSWGGMLALEYLLDRQPEGVASLVLASAPASAPLWRAEVRRLRDQLPAHVVRAMARYESAYQPPRARRTRRSRSTKVRRGISPKTAGLVATISRTAFDALAQPAVVRAAAAASAFPPLRRVAYEIVNVEYIRRHVMRGRPRDAPLSAFRSFAGMNRQVYEAMWGPSEFFGQGALCLWDVSDRLGGITVPTLVTSGRHDEATPRQMTVLVEGIRDASWVVFEDSAHGALMEEPQRYLEVVGEFLDGIDATGALGNVGEALPTAHA
ncbi:MAG TPA: alpha/beta fold hydrolase [Nitriliruptorales bacterium]|nr:alpha/beta fold hydrolase [Nitriliruptorales bacterium]